jgi:membrane-bound serine protease (ClpP class)
VSRWPLALATTLLAFQPVSASAQQALVYRIPVTGTIELGLAPYIARGIEEAHTERAAVIVLDIDTPGGRIDAAQQIVRAVTGSELPIYALVNTHAWSAGAVIALAADSIYMTPGSSIGAATPVTGGGQKAPEKIVSAMRSEMRALAERRGLDPRVAEAMVDEEIAIDGVIEEGKLLTLTAQESVHLAIAVAVVEDLDALLERQELADAAVETVGINWAEQLVRFLSNPFVAPLLLSIGTLGLIIEIKSPSFGIAGFVGLASLAAFFGSHLIVGLAGLEEVILLGAGLVALGIEVFVVPGFGVAGVIAILCIGSAIFLALIGNLPTWGDVTRASGILFTTAMIIVAAVYVLVRHLPTARRSRGIFLRAATDRAHGYIAGSTRDDLVGLEGVAITDLRPAGTVKVGDERLDVVSDVGFVAKGKRVRVIRSESYRHVVEPVDEQPSA